MTDHTATEHDLEEHRKTYSIFVQIVIAAVIHILYALVALVAIGFAQTAPTAVGSLGFIVGTVVVAVTLFSGSRNWMPAVGLLILFALITASLL